MKVTNGAAKEITNKITGVKLNRDTLIIIDSREQRPYWTGSQCLKAPLAVGDYTTVTLLNRFHVERKSPQDLYQTITKGHSRFKAEIKLAEKKGITLVVLVETSFKNFYEKRFPGGSERQYPSTGLKRIVETIQQRYGLEFIWSSGRNKAAKTLLSRLRAEQRKIR